MLENIKGYYYPDTLEGALTLLSEKGESCIPIAGGTYIVPSKDRKITELVDIGRLGLSYILEDEKGVRIGSTTTLQEIAESQILGNLAGGILCEAARSVATKLVRNAATIGGSLLSPLVVPDMPLPLIVLGAEAMFAGTLQEISILVEDLFSANSHSRFSGSILREIFIPEPMRGTGGSFFKLTRTRVDVAIVNAATLLVLRGGICWKARIAVGTEGVSPVRIARAEKLMEGQPPDEELLSKVSGVASQTISPLTDHRASAGYKREMCRILVRRSLAESICRVGEEMA